MIQAFVSEHDLKHRILLNGSDVHRRYGEAIPSAFWIDREGVIRYVELGFDGPETLERETKRLLQRG